MKPVDTAVPKSTPMITSDLMQVLPDIEPVEVVQEEAQDDRLAHVEVL